MREKIQRFMIGRYGVDQFGRFLLWAAIVCMFLDILFRIRGINWLALLLLIFAYFRILSRDISRRYQENQKYLGYEFRVREKLKRWKFRVQEMKHYHIYRCPSCGQKIRIPRGRGRVSIHCPKCGTDFIKKS